MDANQIKELHGTLLKAIGDSRFSDVNPIVQSVEKNRVADNPSKSYVTDERGRRVGVLIISNPVNPQLVARSVAMARECKHVLGDELGSVILEPIVEDVFSDLSFALWPIHRDLSSSRVIRQFQKRFVKKRALRWLEAVTRHTMHVEIEPEQSLSLYAAPLKRMLNEAQFSAGLRSAASQALHRLSSGTLATVTVLQHSDLWLGNFLLPLRCATKRNAHGFYVIDWAGAIICGHPILDLLRFSALSGVSRRRLRSEIVIHCKIIGCELVDAVSYTVAALGILGMNLQHFPKCRYLRMSEGVFETVSAALE